MRQQIRRVTHGRLATIGCVLALVLTTLGCSTSDESESEKHEDFEEFSFPAVEGQDDECDVDCGPSTTNMCDMTYSGDVLAIVRVLGITEHRDSCEDRPYRRDYKEVTIDVVDVAAGDHNFANANSYNSFIHNVYVEVGKTYIVILNQVEGVWWAGGAHELIPGPNSTAVSPDEGGPVDGHGGGTIYDLPTNRTDFVAEANRAWNNYEDECDPEGRRGTSPEFHNYIFGKSCPDSDSSPPPAVSNNDNGPIPGDDDYNAGD